MKKYLRFFPLIAVSVLLCLLASPLLSLLFPEALANRVYYRLLYNNIASRETASCVGDDEKAEKLLRYVTDHELLAGIPVKCKPADSLIYGQAYCDYQARVLNALLGVIGIKSRYAMLLDKNGLSPHTLNEVFLGNKWCVFDTSMNIVYKDSQGKKLSLDDLSANPSLIYNCSKIAALKNYDLDGYAWFETWHKQMFPMPAQPRRSKPAVYQAHIIDKTGDFYFKVFNPGFFNVFQDVYLNWKKNYSGKDDFRLFFKARNYHLAGRLELADKYYTLLMEKYPGSDFAQDTVFFQGMLNFETGKFSAAAEGLTIITSDKYGAKWKPFAYYYLGKSYAAMGDHNNSMKAYASCGILNLSAETLRELAAYKIKTGNKAN